MTRAIRQAEIGAARTMIERTVECFGIHSERLVADSAYGSLGWPVADRAIEPHIPVFDKSARSLVTTLPTIRKGQHLTLPSGQSSGFNREAGE